MNMETPTPVMAVRRAVLSGLLFWPMLTHAQSTNGLVDETDLLAYDRYGHAVEIGDLAVPDQVNGFMGGGGPTTCTAGWFNLVFTDNNVGFNDPGFGATYRDIACRVFSDLSVLIDPANDPYTLLPPIPGFVNIELRLPTNPLPGALGMGSSFYGPINFWSPFLGSVTPVAMQRRVLDGEVWKTINGGFDSWAVQRNALFPWALPTAFFHGFVHIDFDQFPNTSWHLAPGAPPVAPPFDLYTVIFHEALHGLGISSFLNATGGSQFPGSNYYSRWDMRLQTGGSAVMNNQWQCNAVNFSGAAINTNCAMTFMGPNTTQPVHSPNAFTGSSFDHFDGSCPGGFPYLMHPGPIAGQSRIPLQEEAFALCDLDFHTTTSVGTDPTWIGTVVTNYTSCGSRIAGVDDIYEYNTQNLYIYQQGQASPLVIDDFLTNDEDQAKANTQADEFDPCVEILRGGGTVNVLSATSIDYTPAAGFVGWAILRYLPVNSNSGAHGNYTHIFIHVGPPSACDDMDCNIVNGGDFEMITTFYCEPYSYWRISNQNSPDHLFFNGVNWAYGGLPMGSATYTDYCAGSSQPVPPSHNGAPFNNHYVSMVGGGTPGNQWFNQEGVELDLCLPLEPGDNYVLDFWARNPSAGCNAVLDFRAFEQRPCLQGMGPTDITGGPMNCFDLINPFSAITFMPGPIVLTDQWVNYQIPFTFPGGANGNWITAFMSNPIVGGSAGSVYIDDIRIQPVIDITGVVTDACTGQNDGMINITVNGGSGNYTYSWSNSATSEDLTGLAPGPYTVTVTDATLGCIGTETFNVGTQACDPWTITKTANVAQTYAGSPVIFTITICNNTGAAANVNVTDVLPTDFTLAFTYNTNPFPGGSVSVPSGCTDYFVSGYFSTIGSCTDPDPAVVAMHTNTVTLVDLNGTLLTADDCVSVLVGCPMAVAGAGDCAVGSIVDMCLLVHTQFTGVTSVDYQLLFPTFLSIPGNPAAGVVVDLDGTNTWEPFAGANIVGGGASTISWQPFLPSYPGPLGFYNVATIHVEYTAPVSVSPPYQFVCIDFTLQSAPPALQNSWSLFAMSPGGVLNQVQVNPVGTFWTQALPVTLNGCPDVEQLEPSFTVDVPSCGGEVTVNADFTDPAAVHIWTWGDNRTTPTNGAQTWTYDYFATITDNQGWPVNIPPAPPGTYTITHTVILNGVSTSTTQTITIYACCAAALVIEDGTLSSSIGSSAGGTVDVRGQFIIDQDFMFMGADVKMEPGAEIIVQSGVIFDINGTSIESCQDVMWKSITANSGAMVYIQSSFIDDAENALTGLDGAILVANNTQFHNNRVAVQIPAVGGVPWNNVPFVSSNNMFYSAGPMAQPYPGQTTVVGQQGYAAIEVANTDLNFTIPGNIIHSLSNGIVGRRANMTVSGCTMMHIQPDPAYVSPQNGAGIYARGGHGFFTLKQVGFGMSGGGTSFNNCRWGIYTEYMNVRSEQNQMVQVGTAYHIERSGYMDIDIWNNTLDTKFDGIQLYMNDGCAHMLVQNNDITFATNPPFGQFVKGYTAIVVKEANTANPNSVIQNNTIHYRPGATTAHGGIKLLSANDFSVLTNTLIMDDNAYNYAGIYMSGCSRPLVSCNNVQGSFGNYGLNDGQSAIRNNMGDRPTIYCNNVDGTINGIYFSGPAYGTDLAGNNINEHKWGLHLDNSAIIEQQDYKGNLWCQPMVPGGDGAWYENPINAQTYKFKYDATLVNGCSPEPPTWTPSYWFTWQPGQNYLCEDVGYDYCGQFVREHCEHCKTELDERIAGDDMENNPYTEETQWIMNGKLYEKLDNAPEMMDTDEALADFYSAMQNTTIAQFKQINDDYLALFDLAPSVRDYLLANRAQMEALMTELNEAMAQLGDASLTPAERQALVGTISGLQQALSDLATLNNQALELAAEGRVLTADNVMAANDGIGSSEVIETNEQQVKEIYLSTVAKDIDGFSADEAAQLFDIANQCPMVGGNAVYRARSLYALIDDEVEFDDPTLCLAHGILVRSMEEADTRTVQVMPNPAADEATLVYQLNEGATGTLLIHDAVGKEVMRLPLSADMQRFYFSTAALAPGAYHYLVLEEQGLLGEGKLTIVR